ncbi:hypothetical protein P7C70_g7478, partial [Phenoliferia sp. Uapishka_3]
MSSHKYQTRSKSHGKKGLPTEIWLEIFAFANLDYFDLKRVAQVCKAFQAICNVSMSFQSLLHSARLTWRLQLPRFDSILFRGGASPSHVSTNQKIALHPIFKAGVHFSMKDRKCYYIHPDQPYEPTDLKISELACAGELATYPPRKLDYRRGKRGKYDYRTSLQIVKLTILPQRAEWETVKEWAERVELHLGMEIFLHVQKINLCVVFDV